ncbi:unnamed protein product, partial [Symbiodinium pilosum]
EYFYEYAERFDNLAPLEEQKKVVLPDGSTLMVRDYHDLFCTLNGYYNVSRVAAVNDYEFLTHVSAQFCSVRKQQVPNYNSLTLNDLVLHEDPHNDYINKLLMSSNPVVYLNQSDLDMFHTEAAVECRLDNDSG